MTTAVLFANTSWYLYNFRLSLARALREAGLDLILLAPEDRYSSMLLDQGFDWRPVRLSRSAVNPIDELKSLLEVFRIYRAIRPGVVHHFTLKPVLYGSLAAKLANVPAVINAVTGGGYMYSDGGLRRRLMRIAVSPLYRFAFRGKGIRTIFQNLEDAKEFQRMGFASGRAARLIPGSGVNLERFHPYPEPEGPVTVLMASRMLRDKGVVELVNAARLLRGRNVEIRLAGGTDAGNPSSVREQDLRQWEEQGLIRWLGHVEDIRVQYSECHIVAFPSYREGLSRTLIEAAACSRPIVTTNVPGCREVVEHERSGLIVPPRDERALAEALKRLIDNPDLRQSMGRRGREIAVEKFSEASVIAQTISVYEELLEAGSIDTKSKQAGLPGIDRTS